ncbi:MAG: hypothetical protein ACRD3G_10445 [Vicinamibacterales bacterium]
MTRAIYLLVTALGLTVAVDAFQRGTQPAYRVRFAGDVDLMGLEIRYQLTGPFGGVRTFVRTDPAVRDYAIDTSYEGRKARALKAIVYRPGFRFVLLAEPALEDSRVEAAPINLEPLTSIPLSGNIVLARPVNGLMIEARYLARWGHEFFGIADGSVEAFTVAKSTIATDGTFTLNVPDFVRDPVPAAYARDLLGSLQLVVRESASGNIPYGLEDVQRRGRPAELAIAPHYPQDLQLVVVPR